MDLFFLNPQVVLWRSRAAQQAHGAVVESEGDEMDEGDEDEGDEDESHDSDDSATSDDDYDTRDNDYRQWQRERGSPWT